ncbi:hypothetical protein D7Y16_16650 [Stenotrophomonas maltophilia]|nr:hypothetical protein [Stenotrophomonas maltophilia]MBA0248690.1 hypothetical protein [Stenotrophomonas maltophilia]MBA0308443.1 hypothetical protein [Stenotrophomonas maltophilia]MBA0440906.1 hypothetical protein [Stenotrophomonas maltophilia]MBA0517260.1 hypothetical protein [Stenotrophomonas maltophilia]
MSMRPESAVRARVGSWGALGALLGFVLGRSLECSSYTLWLLLVLGAAIPMWLLEWRRLPHALLMHDRRSALWGIFTISILQVAILLLQFLFGGDSGAAVVLALPFLLVAGSILLLLGLLRPSLLGSTIPDAGNAVRAWFDGGRPNNSQRNALLGWCVKCFFLPLMLAWSWTWLASLEYALPSTGSLRWYALGMIALYAIDTAFGVIGYVSTSKHLGGEIRSVDSTMLGWLSALACYPPLSALVLDTWLIARNANDWKNWLSEGSPLAVIWAISILLLTSVYTWSTVVFGTRFSNLTHRGIITHGPYRWTKHPAYMCKNLSWWLVSVPFISNGGVAGVLLSCLAMLAVNAIYWVRARTEERHLLMDADYRRYAEWIDDNGIVSILRRCGLKMIRSQS